MEDGCGEPKTVGGRLKAAVIFETSRGRKEGPLRILTTGVHLLWRPFWDRFCAGLLGRGDGCLFKAAFIVAGES